MKANILCIAGGGSTYTAGIVNTLMENFERFPISEIRLYDIDEEKNHQSKLIIDYLVKKSDVDIRVIASSDPQEAFTNVDYIFSQIRAGGLSMREQDEKIPLHHGLVGQETCGLGGFSYGLRSIKAFLEMMALIQTYAPNAWVLNYTNPESLISEAVRRAYPHANIINACDMTISIERTLAENYGYDHDNWIVNYYGLNHFGWYESIYDVSYQRDIMPDILERAVKEGVELKEGDDSWKETYRNLGRLIQFFPDHIPNNYLEYYLMPDEKVKTSDPNYTRANYVMDHRAKDMATLAQAIVNEDEEVIKQYDLESENHGQYIVDIAISHYHNLNKRFNLIVPNQGAIANLRNDAVVEVPAYVNRKGVEAISLRKPIPDFHKGLMEAQVAAEKLLVDAYFENSYQKALQAFTLNLTVPSVILAKKILDEMIEVNGDLWPKLK